MRSRFRNYNVDRFVAYLAVAGWLFWSTQITVGSAIDSKKEAGDESSEPPSEELMAMGKELYEQRCAFCHQPDGTGLSGVFPPLVDGMPFEAAPNITRPLEERGFYKNGKIVLGSLDEHIDIVVNGMPGTRMFAFGPELTNEEIAAVVTYERNAWDNDTGEVVTPEQIEPFRNH